VLINLTGHKQLYTNGVLHRDVSPGNILIEWVPGSEVDKPSTSGCLIDLDRGKKGKSKQSPSQPTAAIADRDVNTVRDFIDLSSVETDVARQALECLRIHQSYPAIANYITEAVKHALRFEHLTTGNICTVHNLRWKQVWPHYSSFLWF
jgi:serine/threonine protein kinase